MNPQHTPVMATEVIENLQLQSGLTVLDGTVGLGGHAAMMAEIIGPKGVLWGFDRDASNLELARANLKNYPQAKLIHASFAQMREHVDQADRILMDLGFSSVHVDDPMRGFSFQSDGPLDMRYDQTSELTAAMVVNSWPKDELARIIRQYGEEPKAYKIADAITKARKKERFTRTLQLADLIATIIPRRGPRNPATTTFQALRIAVNDELGEVERGLEAAVQTLKPGGKIGVITFHSLEDRIVKNFFRSHPELSPDTKKPLIPTRNEILSNPRARSAKFRVATKL